MYFRIMLMCWRFLCGSDSFVVTLSFALQRLRWPQKKVSTVILKCPRTCIMNLNPRLYYWQHVDSDKQ